MSNQSSVTHTHTHVCSFMIYVLLSFASLSHLLSRINTVLRCPTHLELHTTFQASSFLNHLSGSVFHWCFKPCSVCVCLFSRSFICFQLLRNKTMLTCISCSKQVSEEDGNAEDVGRTKVAAKSFTAQIKELRHKLKKTCRGSTATGYNKGNMPLLPLDNICHGIPYNSTTAWDFGSSGHHTDSSSQATCSNRQVICERQSEDMPVNGEDDGPQEWIAQVEPGVHITFTALPDGGNDLRRIRFSREMFNKRQAQCWWGENFNRILELYNVCRFNRQAPLRSEDGRDSSCSSRLGSVRDSPMTTPWESYRPFGYPRQTGFSTYSGNGANDTATSSRDEASMSGNSEVVENEWVEQDEPGVYITIRQMVDGTRELRRVRFSRGRFVEGDAKQWWDGNRARIQAHYL